MRKNRFLVAKFLHCIGMWVGVGVFDGLRVLDGSIVALRLCTYLLCMALSCISNKAWRSSSPFGKNGIRKSELNLVGFLRLATWPVITSANAASIDACSSFQWCDGTIKLSCTGKQVMPCSKSLSITFSAIIESIYWNWSPTPLPIESLSGGWRLMMSFFNLAKVMPAFSKSLRLGLYLPDSSLSRALNTSLTSFRWDA